MLRRLPCLFTLLSLLALLAACQPAVRPAGTTAAATAGSALIVRLPFGIAAGASVEVPDGALPPGATVRLIAGSLALPPGFVALSAALRVEFSVPLAAGTRARVRIPFDGCGLMEQGRDEGDLVLYVSEGGPVIARTPPATDGALFFEVGADAVLQAAVPEGIAPLRTPLAALSRRGIALDRGGSVHIWGEGNPFPAPLPWEERIVAVEAGDGFAMALLADGSLHAWGANLFGQLGSGDFVSRSAPAPVAGLSCVTRVHVGPGAATVLALTIEGELFAWGRNREGQLGTSTLFDAPRPVRLMGIEFPRDFAGTRHVLVAMEDGSVLALGAGERGQLGQGNFQGSLAPRTVDGLEDIVAVAAGAAFSLALAKGGRVYSFGANERGQLGDGTFEDRTRPVMVEGLPPIVAIRAATRTAMALDDRGGLHVWGAGEWGQLGSGDFRTSQTTPLPLATAPVLDFDGGIDAFVIALFDGTFLSMGLNDSGQLGDGAFLPRNLPTPLLID